MSTELINAVSRNSFQPAPRLQQSLTAVFEKRVLLWLAALAPRWLTSDQLTILGFTAQLSAGAAYVFARQHPLALLIVNACIVLNWLGDSLDGTLARVRHQQRPRFGFYVDHMADVFGAVALMSGLACSGFVHGQIAIAMLIAFLILAAESFLTSYTLSRFELSQGIFGPTEIRLLLIAGNFALLRRPYFTLAGHHILLFDFGGLIAAAAMSAIAVTVAAHHTAQLYREEPLP